jgi:hypothetical protein
MNRQTQSSSAFGTLTSLPLHRRVVQDCDRNWSRSVLNRLNHLVALQRGWDGYGGHAVQFDTAAFALKLLESAFDSDVPAPQIVPGSDGGLQLEWHLEQGDIELDVEAPYRVYAWSNIAGEEAEVQLTNDFTVVSEWLAALSETSVATAATA